jgi:hypothetical protein
LEESSSDSDSSDFEEPFEEPFAGLWNPVFNPDIRSLLERARVGGRGSLSEKKRVGEGTRILCYTTYPFLHSILIPVLMPGRLPLLNEYLA